ncbi:hypothetical protein D3C76_1121000 [compost metagenome]
MQAHDLAHFVDVQRACIEQLDHALDADLLEVGFTLFDTARGHQDQLVEQRGLGQAQADGNGAAQGIAEQGAALDVEGLEQAGHRTDKEVQVVLDVIGFVRAPEAWQVDDQVAKAGGHEVGVVALEVAVATGAWPTAVQPQHHGATAFVEVVQAQAVVQGDEVAYGQR